MELPERIVSVGYPIISGRSSWDLVLITSFVAKVVAWVEALGGWLLAQVNSPLVEHRFWPMVIGVVVTVAVIALFRFPLIPGFVGTLLNFIVILFGLGALWLWGRETRRSPSSYAVG